MLYVQANNFTRENINKYLMGYLEIRSGWSVDD